MTFVASEDWTVIVKGTKNRCVYHMVFKILLETVFEFTFMSDLIVFFSFYSFSIVRLLA